MKYSSIALILSIVLVGCAGCSNSKNINIDQWMLSDELTPKKAIKKLNTPLLEKANILQWDNIELINGIKGSLSLRYDKTDILNTVFIWETPNNNNSYSIIHDTLSNNYNELIHESVINETLPICDFDLQYESIRKTESGEEYKSISKCELSKQNDIIYLEFGPGCFQTKLLTTK